MSNLGVVVVGHFQPYQKPVVWVDPFFVDEDEWRAAMQDSIDASLEVDDNGAWELGHAHAISGHPFRACVYERMCDRAEYIIGFRDGKSTLDYEEYLQDAGGL